MNATSYLVEEGLLPLATSTNFHPPWIEKKYYGSFRDEKRL